jgi:hypothetical protein
MKLISLKRKGEKPHLYQIDSISLKRGERLYIYIYIYIYIN